MAGTTPDVTAALATLQARWGAAAPRRGRPVAMADGEGSATEVVGSLAIAPLPLDDAPLQPLGPLALPTGSDPAARPDPGRIVPTGFPDLDAILGQGGLPRTAGVAFRGEGSTGATTVALRLVAEAQATGAIVAWLDLGRSLDPVEAVARGVRLEWLVVLVPETIDEGLAMAGTLLGGRAVDLLVVDLPAGGRQGRGRGVAERFHRLAALARRAETLLVVLQPASLPDGLSGAVAESVGIRLELARRAWIRLGRDVVGQRTEVTVARNRYGPPGRRTELQILYAEGGPRDACLRRRDLLTEAQPEAPPGPIAALEPASIPIDPIALGAGVPPPPSIDRIPSDASPPSLLAAPSAPTRPVPLHVLSERSDRPRRAALDRRDGPRRDARRAGARDPAGHAARHRAPALARGDIPRP